MLPTSLIVTFALPVLACLAILFGTPGLEPSLFTTSLTVFAILAAVGCALVEVGILAEQGEAAPSHAAA